MNFYARLALLCRHCSLLRTAMAYLYGFVPLIFVICLFLACTGCVYIDWEYGRMPKLKVDTEWCDDMDLKGNTDLDELVIECEWEWDL